MSRDFAVVLGGGGLAAWLFHTGVVEALTSAGVDPTQATVVIGTSAGSSAAAMLRLGRTPDEMFRAFTYEPTAAERRAAAEERRAIPHSWAPLSPRLVTAGLRSGRSGLGLAFAGALPAGRWSSHYLGRTDPGFDGEWPDRLWIPAVDADDGSLLVLGRDLHPPLATAIAASSALPFLFRPVEVAGKRLIDGGVLSPTHADLAQGARVDTVIVSSPMTRAGRRAFALHARHRLHTEIEQLKEAGVTPLVIEPDATSLPAFRSYPRERTRAPELRSAGRRAAAAALARGGMGT